jgi:TPR repeat protein
MRWFLLCLVSGVVAAQQTASLPQTRPAFEKLCNAGDAAACTRAGEMHEFGLERPGRSQEPNPKAALPFYERACQAAHFSGCARLAALQEKGEVVAQDPARAAALYAKSCDGGHFAGCTGLARMLEQGSGVSRDPARAKILYDRAVALETASCDRGDAEECVRLAHFYSEGTIGLSKDPAQAMRLYERACTLDDSTGCSQAAYLAGTGAPGLPRDQARAETFQARWREVIVRQCDAGRIDACTTLMTPMGDYKACLVGDTDSCWRVGNSYVPSTPESPGDYMRALHFFLKACDLEAEHCEPAAELYAEGRGVSANPQRAAELFGRACDAGNFESCYQLAVRHETGTGVPRDPLRAAALYQRTCEGDPLACTPFAKLLLLGQGVERNGARAVELLRKPCEARDMEACQQIGLAYRDGNGVTRDPAAALKQLSESCRFEGAVGCRDACDLGDGAGCKRAADKVDAADSVPPNPGEASALYERAALLLERECARGIQESCNALRGLFESARPLSFKDLALALRFYRRLCEARAGEACHMTARMYDRGEGTPVDRRQAAALYDLACDFGQIESCDRGAEMFRLGQGVPASPARAADFAQRAAELRRFRRR